MAGEDISGHFTKKIDFFVIIEALQFAYDVPSYHFGQLNLAIELYYQYCSQ